MFKIIGAFIGQYKIYFGLAVCVICFGAGLYVGHVFHEASQVRDLRAQIDEHAKSELAANVKSAALEAELSKQRASNSHLNQDAKNEVRKTIYNCVVPTSGKLLINKAVAGTSAR